MTNQLKIGFAGTPEYAAHNLSALLDSGHNVCAVYTQPDRPSGRGRKVKASAVKELATANNIAIYQPENFKHSDDINQLELLDLDVLVVVAYGIILPQRVLDIPRFGCINVHASLLPRWRGAAPIERSLLSGDEQVGVTIMQMDSGLDTGDMLIKKAIDTDLNMTSADLYQALLPLGSSALIDTLSQIASKTLNPVEQDNQLACYAHKLSKEEAAIDWQLSAKEVLRKIKGMSPRPVAHSELNGSSIRIWNARLGTTITAGNVPGQIIGCQKDSIEVCCGDTQSILLTELQLPGAKRLTAQQVLNAKQALFTAGFLFNSL